MFSVVFVVVVILVVVLVCYCVRRKRAVPDQFAQNAIIYNQNNLYGQPGFNQYGQNTYVNTYGTNANYQMNQFNNGNNINNCNNVNNINNINNGNNVMYGTGNYNSQNVINNINSNNNQEMYNINNNINNEFNANNYTVDKSDERLTLNEKGQQSKTDHITTNDVGTSNKT